MAILALTTVTFRIRGEKSLRISSLEVMLTSTYEVLESEVSATKKSDVASQQR